MAAIENFDLRWDALSQSIDNAEYRVPEDTAPRVVDFLSGPAAGVLWTQLNVQKIRDLHRLIGAEGPRTTKLVMVPAIDLVIRNLYLDRPRADREDVENNNDPVHQFLDGFQPPPHPVAAPPRPIIPMVVVPPAVAPVVQPVAPPRPVVPPAIPQVIPPVAGGHGNLPSAARDLPRIVLAGGVHRAPIQRAARVPIDLSAGADDDPIEIDGDSDDNNDVTQTSTSSTTSADLGEIALRTLNSMNITCVDWMTTTDRERPWRVARNQHEAMNIARIFDLIGVRSNHFIKSAMLKRIIALQHFDSTGNVNVLDVVQGSSTELLPIRFLNGIYTQLQRRTQSQSRADRSSSSSSSSQQGSGGRRRQHPQQRSSTYSQPPAKKHRGPPPAGGSAGSQ